MLTGMHITYNIPNKNTLTQRQYFTYNLSIVVMGTEYEDDTLHIVLNVGYEPGVYANRSALCEEVMSVMDEILSSEYGVECRGVINDTYDI